MTHCKGCLLKAISFPSRVTSRTSVDTCCRDARASGREQRGRCLRDALASLPQAHRLQRPRPDREPEQPDVAAPAVGRQHRLARVQGHLPRYPARGQGASAGGHPRVADTRTIPSPRPWRRGLTLHPPPWESLVAVCGAECLTSRERGFPWHLPWSRQDRERHPVWTGSRACDTVHLGV